MSMKPSMRKASYADLEALPGNMVGEIIHGVLEAHPRPAPRHAIAATSLGDELTSPFQKGRGEPGGWIIIDEPELLWLLDPVEKNLEDFALSAGFWLLMTTSFDGKEVCAPPFEAITFALSNLFPYDTTDETGN